jgi:predicted ATPase
MENIAVNFGFNKEWWTKNTLYKTNNIDNLENNWLSLSWQPSKFHYGYFFRAEWIYNFVNHLQNMDSGLAFSPYGWENLHNFSHGQQFMKIFEAQMDKVWFYVLDEIESALSPANQLKVIEVIKYMVNNGSQFLIATHSPIILGIKEKSQILSFDYWYIHQIDYDMVPCVDMYRRVLMKKQK